MNGGLRAGKSPARPLFTASPPLPSTIADEPRPRSTTLPNGLIVTLRVHARGAVRRARCLGPGGVAARATATPWASRTCSSTWCSRELTRRSAKEIALALEGLGGSLDAYTAREHTAYQARVLDANLREAADVLVDLVYRPLLRATDLKLERKVVLEEISMVRGHPGRSRLRAAQRGAVGRAIPTATRSSGLGTASRGWV